MQPIGRCYCHVQKCCWGLTVPIYTLLGLTEKTFTIDKLAQYINLRSLTVTGNQSKLKTSSALAKVDYYYSFSSRAQPFLLHFTSSFSDANWVSRASMDKFDSGL